MAADMTASLSDKEEGGPRHVLQERRVMQSGVAFQEGLPGEDSPDRRCGSSQARSASCSRWTRAAATAILNSYRLKANPDLIELSLR